MATLVAPRWDKISVREFHDPGGVHPRSMTETRKLVGLDLDLSILHAPWLGIDEEKPRALRTDADGELIVWRGDESAIDEQDIASGEHDQVTT